MIYEFTLLWTCVAAGEYVLAKEIRIKTTNNEWSSITYPISICMFTKAIFELFVSLPEFTNRLLGDDGFPLKR